jgi:hypothetical protein
MIQSSSDTPCTLMVLLLAELYQIPFPLFHFLFNFVRIHFFIYFYYSSILVLFKTRQELIVIIITKKKRNIFKKKKKN